MADKGRPSKYDPKFCEDIIKFFDIDHTIIKTKTITRKDGSREEIEEEVANKLPTFERFSVNCGVCRDSLVEWTKQHEEFSVAYKKAKELQKDMLIHLGMVGLYNPIFTIFTAKNITDMKDKVEHDGTAFTVLLDHKESKV